MSKNCLLIYAEQLATDAELLYKTNYITETEYKALDTACTSIRVMLISSINTAKENAK
ncbi:MAG: hypothetical protein IJN86_06980 [Clostridia bacterium]|nr:hypothetical protein [Clostridia bacterium]